MHIKHSKVETAFELGFNIMEDISCLLNECCSNKVVNFVVNSKQLTGNSEHVTL
jgi:hypothetical protein